MHANVPVLVKPGSKVQIPVLQHGSKWSAPEQSHVWKQSRGLTGSERSCVCVTLNLLHSRWLKLANVQKPIFRCVLYANGYAHG